MKPKPKVVAAGYMPLDVVSAEDGLLSRNAGGTAANVAAILAFLGWRSVLAGQSGSDYAGKELVADLAAAGVATDQVHQRADMLTPRLVHEVLAGGHYFVYTCPTCHVRFPRSRPLTIEQAHICIAAHPSATVFFFDRANPATLTLAEHYRKHGSIVAYEPAGDGNTELQRRAIRLAHVVKRSDERVLVGPRGRTSRPVDDHLRIVTLGAQGLELHRGDRCMAKLPAFPTVVADPGGAGDWTTAGFLHETARTGELSSGGALEDALVFGQALAALSCSVVGARSLMRLTRRTIVRRANGVRAEGSLKREMRLPAQPPLDAPDDACPTCLMPLGVS